jgi:AbrB family looped-hinge helix DNA binding protein
VPGLENGIADGKVIGMATTITMGKAGRLVVPKSVRDSLGLREGARLQIHVSGGGFEAVPEPDAVLIEMKDGLPVIRGGPARRKGDLVKAIKAEREEREQRIRPPSRRK